MDRITRGQKQDRGGDLPVPQVCNDAPAVADRQHDIENDQVMESCPGKVGTVFTVIGNIDGEAVFFQATFQVRGRLAFVFDDQNLHWTSVDRVRGGAGSPSKPTSECASKIADSTYPL